MGLTLLVRKRIQATTAADAGILFRLPHAIKRERQQAKLLFFFLASR